MKIKQFFRFNPTVDQAYALEALESFFKSHDDVFILRGYAGTGKTSLLTAVVRFLEQENVPYYLMTPTGRAARVLSQVTSRQAKTIHSTIYQVDENSIDPESKKKRIIFRLKQNYDHPRTVYIIDESSMIADRENPNPAVAFEEGKLLHHILHYSGGRKVVFVGDQAQLPPVGSGYSAALVDEHFISNYNKATVSADLRTVVRQSETSHILENATKLREIISSGTYPTPSIRASGCEDIKLVPNIWIMLGQYTNRYSPDKEPNSAFIAYSNGSVFYLNSQIRNRIYQYQDPPLQSNELLMVVQNNYLYEIFNGQQIRLVDYSDLGEQVNGIHFIEATVVEPETGRPKRVKMFRDLLFRKEPNLSLVEDSEIMKDFAIRMRKEGIREKTEAYLQRFLQDSRVNALRVKFGYAMTCHKAQGGEWKNVFLNFEPALENLNREMQYRWLYTALTRARKNLFVPEHPFTY